jgi:uncharacterized membrane protein
MLRQITSLLMRGLAAVLPIGLTVWLLWWLGSSTEALLHRAIVLFIPEEHYWPGLGILACLVLLLLAGALVNALLVRRLLRTWEGLLERIPVVKTVYGSIRDFVRFLPATGEKRDLRRVVVATFGDARAIGFVTRDDAVEISALSGEEGLVAVYFPMSYQIGGYTLYLPRRCLTPLDMPVEDAMRMVLTGGLSGPAPAR